MRLGSQLTPRQDSSIASGNLYVADTHNDRVLMTTEGDDAVEPPFTGRKKPSGVAVDTSGNVYVADTYNDRVLSSPLASPNPCNCHSTGSVGRTGWPSI